MITIILGHPLEDSLSAATCDALTEHLRETNQPYHLIDLYKEGFQPAMTKEERSKFFDGIGESDDPLVRQYQNVLREADHLVFIFPIWFMQQPAVISGFIERAFLPGFAYAYTENGTEPLLTNIKKVTVITSSGAPTEALTGRGNVIENHFLGHIIYNMTGPMKNNDAATWINMGMASQEKLDAHVEKVKERF